MVKWIFTLIITGIFKFDKGISIGPNHIHGGVSKGAVGFDAFYPKRIEDKYKSK